MLWLVQAGGFVDIDIAFTVRGRRIGWFGESDVVSANDVAQVPGERAVGATRGRAAVQLADPNDERVVFVV